MSLRGLRCLDYDVSKRQSCDTISSPASPDDSDGLPRRCPWTEVLGTDRIFRTTTISVSGFRRRFLSRVKQTRKTCLSKTVP
jgi:hypothetical protein